MSYNDFLHQPKVFLPNHIPALNMVMSLKRLVFLIFNTFPPPLILMILTFEDTKEIIYAILAKE